MINRKLLRLVSTKNSRDTRKFSRKCGDFFVFLFLSLLLLSASPFNPSSTTTSSCCCHLVTSINLRGKVLVGIAMSGNWPPLRTRHENKRLARLAANPTPYTPTTTREIFFYSLSCNTRRRLRQTESRQRMLATRHSTDVFV